MKDLVVCVLFAITFMFALLFGIDREMARRDYIARSDLRDEITGCIFDMNCRHYNKLLNKTEYNKENWDMED